MAQSKVYEILKGATVAPSKIESIEYHVNDNSKFHIKHCKLTSKGTKYLKSHTLITFAHSNGSENIEGVQPEQLAIVMREFLIKQDNVKEAQIKALDDFLNACK